MKDHVNSTVRRRRHKKYISSVAGRQMSAAVSDAADDVLC